MWVDLSRGYALRVTPLKLSRYMRQVEGPYFPLIGDLGSKSDCGIEKSTNISPDTETWVLRRKSISLLCLKKKSERKKKCLYNIITETSSNSTKQLKIQWHCNNGFRFFH
jgi:hypothetical protein